jgi:hypothetical protein
MHSATPSLYTPDNPQQLEKYSCAVTLSDMEVFIFPELMLALLLANIMSPLPWRWREDSWFAKSGGMSPYRKIMRVKQFIMDRFAFNLDLDTWGLTTKERELARFAAFVDEKILARSNALFGYEGDQYYFDIDIRRHFGLDKYTSNVIPYWKTETVEAMDAFKYKEGYPSGAGECVSLAALYAAVMYVIAGVPLGGMYMLATPLHSQNFIAVRDGILTNNRRIVTQNMFFNGTELAAKARRALENERVTMVIHNSGFVHCIYDEATMDPAAYADFASRLGSFLQTDVTFEILANFLRQENRLQRCFQIVHSCCGKPRYIEAEKVYYYEHSSNLRIGDTTRAKLLHEIDEDEFYPEPLPGRMLLDEVELFFKEHQVSVDNDCDVQLLKKHLRHCCFNVEEVIADLLKFCKISPRLPGDGKTWIPHTPVLNEPVSCREEALEQLEALRRTVPAADLAFMAYRDMTRAPWKPFIKAALERNPVSISGARDLDIDAVAAKLQAMTQESIYDGGRMAQPDEVWNFNRGDGLEKALCLINIIRQRRPADRITLDGDGVSVCVRTQQHAEYRFMTAKKLPLPSEADCTLPPGPAAVI